MAWQRRIPFGYQVRDGQTACHPDEAEAVRSIFARYIAGASYAQIAQGMSAQGVSYHQHTPMWNKNMVKRILENETYLGNKGYPRLVDDKDFLAVRFQRQDRNTYAPCPEYLGHIRKKAVCGICGAGLRRGTRTNGRLHWHCQDPACGATISLADERLREQVLAQLRKLAETPSLLVLPTPDGTAATPDARRIENELNLSFNRQDIGPELMKALICALASERYAALPDPTPTYRLERLRQRLEQEPASESDLWELLDIAVMSIRIGKNGEVTLEPINGLAVEQRKEEPA